MRPYGSIGPSHSVPAVLPPHPELLHPGGTLSTASPQPSVPPGGIPEALGMSRRGRDPTRAELPPAAGSGSERRDPG